MERLSPGERRSPALTGPTGLSKYAMGVASCSPQAPGQSGRCSTKCTGPPLRLVDPGHPELLDQAKVGILAGSLSAGIAGTVLLRLTPVTDATGAQTQRGSEPMKVGTTMV